MLVSLVLNLIQLGRNCKFSRIALLFQLKFTVYDLAVSLAKIFSQCISVANFHLLFTAIFIRFLG